MAEFFHPIPIAVVIAGIVLALAITMLACMPHIWIERALHRLKQRKRR